METVPSNMVLPSRMLIGRGSVQGIFRECAGFGSRGVLVHGASATQSGLAGPLLDRVPRGISVGFWRHAGGEPDLSELARLLDFARAHTAAWIAAVGGGSVLDLAKACAGLFNAQHEPSAYHDGLALEAPGIPYVAAPSTAGTGAEATPNAVLTNEATGQKKSLRDDSFTARLVILDAELLRTCPRPVIAASGMDAFTQAIEAFTSRKASWLSDQFAIKGLELVAANLEAVYSGARGGEADALLLGSYLTGIALSLARLGVVHGIAHPLGARHHAAHGLVCAVCLPHAIELNRTAVGEKYDAMSRAVGGDLLALARRLLTRFGIVSPFRGKTFEDKADIVRETLASGSTAANPKTIAAPDVEWLLSRLVGP